MAPWQISFCSLLIKEALPALSSLHPHPCHVIPWELVLRSLTELGSMGSFYLKGKKKKSLDFKEVFQQTKIPEILVVEHNFSCIENSDTVLASGFSEPVKNREWEQEWELNSFEIHQLCRRGNWVPGKAGALQVPERLSDRDRTCGLRPSVFSARSHIMEIERVDTLGCI